MRILAERPAPAPARAGLVRWLTTTNHKDIGLLYCATSLAFLLAGGLMALLMRAELTRPGLQLLTKDAYHQLFTVHGITMILLAIAPFGLGLGNYLVPLQVGAPDMAFPRLNALSYWLFLLGGLVILSSFGASGGAAATGWTLYVPLSGPKWSPGPGVDLLIVGILLTSASSIMTAVNLMATVYLLRAPGMTMWRLPIFTWNLLIVSLMVLVAFPPVAAGLAMLFIDRQFGGAFFDPAAGGSPVLFQHLFWWFGHPEVYIMILPFFGVVTEIVPVFSRKPLFGYAGMVFASMLIAGLSMTVWAHHMFTTGVVLNPFFSLLSFLIAVPTGIKFFNWIGTMWGGQVRLTTPMLWSLGFMLNFLLGGITGIMVASPPIDYAVHDTYFVVAHFHYTLAGGALFGVFAAISFWFPKAFGIRLREGLGRLAFALTFVGFNLTFFVMHRLGLQGMVRRIPDYPAGLGFTGPNELATAGSLVMALGVLVFLWNVAASVRRREPAGADPWGGYSLEWVTSSPPPEHNFTWLPPIRSERPAFDWRHREDPAVRDRA
ncbi:MAG TPA: cytochrome c oxidase subunit I [Actinomycetota bacterium]|nr:cytochrome c oxidase subunit I [Actinomycetota bacterium]